MRITGSRLRRGWPVLVAALGALAVSVTSAGAATVSNTVTPISGTQVNPCNNENVTYSGDLHTRLNQTVSANGDTHSVLHTNAQDVTGIGDQGNQYQFPLNDNAVTNVDPAQASTSVAHIRVVSSGSGPNFDLFFLIHVTVSASGQLSVLTDHFSTTCQG